MTRRPERGAATVLVLALTALLLLVGLAATGVAAVVVSHRSTQSAADLAALAGAQAAGRGVDPCGAAASVARDNGAELTGCELLGRDVLVSVRRTARPGFGLTFELDARARAGPG